MGSGGSTQKEIPDPRIENKLRNPIPIFSPISSPDHVIPQNSFSLEATSPRSPDGGTALRADVELVSHTFKWNGPSGSDVAVAGTWDNWKVRVTMSYADGHYICFMDLPVGTHEYKYIVDGIWVYTKNLPITRDQKGNINNVLTLQPIEPITLKISSSPPESYTQEEPDWDNLSIMSEAHRRRYGTGPVQLPAHLERALLNTAANPEDPTILPLPHHTLLNHMYSYPGRKASEDDPGLLIYGLSLRYKKKFVTYVYHRASPTDANES